MISKCVFIAISLAGYCLSPRMSFAVAWEDKLVPKVVEQPGIRINLSAPTEATHAWGASEWTLTVENGSSTALPFSRHLNNPMGYGGAAVNIEIARAGQATRRLSSRNSFRGHSPAATKDDVINPGSAGNLLVVLHGQMMFDLNAHGREDAVDVRFVPVFEAPGRHIVTAILCLDQQVIRSSSIAIEIAEPPAGSRQALEALKGLAKAGICVDVQGISFNDPWSKLERVMDFVEKEKHTLYGAQLQLGLTEALLVLVKAQRFGGPPLPLLGASSVTLDRVKSLIPEILPPDFGLEQSLARVRSEYSAEARAAQKD